MSQIQELMEGLANRGAGVIMKIETATDPKKRAALLGELDNIVKHHEVLALCVKRKH